ncbi:MAG: SAF domain-containing protein [Aeromicrobium sp.]|uniref:SAF domain-containing protein n=1 Tax=Aeromicrobium sp. TaxID=1871063 RepID=UPI003C4B9D96
MDRIRAALFDHRRPLAAAFAALAVIAGLQSVRAADPVVPVVVAARDLDSGQVLATDDVRVVSVPQVAKPSHALGRSQAHGRRVAGPIRAGEPITDRQVIEPRDLSGHGADAVLTMVRLDDPAALAGLRVGDQVELVATATDATEAHIVAKNAVIALLPQVDDSAGHAAVVGIITSRTEGLDLAAAALDARLAVLVTS